jgi:protein-S-isoprenylcysteine O-methyltransferase Ste14
MDEPAKTAKTPSKLKAGLSALITTPLYLAVMVWGEGGWSAFLAKPMVVGVCVVTLLSGLAAVFTQANLSGGDRNDPADRRTLYLMIVLSLLGGILPAFFDGRGMWPIGGEAVRQAGLVIYTLGIIARMVPVFVLGRRFSGLVAIQPGHTLVTTGVYGLVRNPSYLGLIVMNFGWALAFNAWVGVLCSVLMIPLLIARMDAEEKMLASQFGDEFAEWKAHTWRLIPWVY